MDKAIEKEKSINLLRTGFLPLIHCPQGRREMHLIPPFSMVHPVKLWLFFLRMMQILLLLFSAATVKQLFLHSCSRNTLLALHQNYHLNHGEPLYQFHSQFVYLALELVLYPGDHFLPFISQSTTIKNKLTVSSLLFSLMERRGGKVLIQSSKIFLFDFQIHDISPFTEKV